MGAAFPQAPPLPVAIRILVPGLTPYLLCLYTQWNLLPPTLRLWIWEHDPGKIAQIPHLVIQMNVFLVFIPVLGRLRGQERSSLQTPAGEAYLMLDIWPGHLMVFWNDYPTRDAGSRGVLGAHHCPGPWRAEGKRGWRCPWLSVPN